MWREKLATDRVVEAIVCYAFTASTTVKEFTSSDLNVQDNTVCIWTNVMDDTLVDSYCHEDALGHRVKPQATELKTKSFQNYEKLVILDGKDIATGKHVETDPDLWKYSKSVVADLKPPLSYYPHEVAYDVNLILDVRNKTDQLFEYKGLDGGVASSNQPSGASFMLGSLNRIMQLLLFLPSEGVKLKPKLERLCSNVTKTSITYLFKSTTCHEDDDHFGNLFSEGGHSARSVNGYDQHAIVPSANISNIVIQAATELLRFLNACFFSHE
ncbi:hypothetical protein FXO38_30564 [Capsicum annuum]|uniref:Uncharacterized protein n=1 Tax=Capsicum annuum TaxID=4072 RepID=A0A2G2ZWY6_CAPAN|nr:hypothetical protein FXO37_32660 [Capsicum annuum]KAF3623836.1 hypothetical protein FXO38_30564 [Capsicum annuum]PHT86503.1 hypothetical protein T459_08609 [Capsicum annuum]